jgi:hypothetical protein
MAFMEKWVRRAGGKAVDGQARSSTPRRQGAIALVLRSIMLRLESTSEEVVARG